jgi:hypothetical protein
MKESSSWYSTCSSLTTSGISGIRVDLELTDELDLNNLFIATSLGLPGLDFYCSGLSTARHLSTTLHLCSPTRSPRSYACVLFVCPPDLPGPSISKHSIYWICLSLSFNPLKDISIYFSKIIFKHNVISKFWIKSNIFISQDKMAPPKPLSSTKERKNKAKILKSWNFPQEIQNPEHLTLAGKGKAKVVHLDLKC